MTDAPPFDPSKPFQTVDAPTQSAPPAFDPSKPFQTEDAAQAQGARDAAARRAPRPGRDVPQYGRDASSSNWQDVGNTVGRILPKANDALAESVGRVADIIPYYGHKAVKALQGESVPEGQGFHPVENSWKHYFGSEGLPPAQSFPQQIADAGGKMLGENLPFMAGTSALAGGGRFAAEAAPTLKNAAKTGYNTVMDAIAAKPVATTANEALASVESGGLGEWMRNHQEEAGRGPLAQRLAEMAGQMGGPTGMLLHPVNVATNAVKPLVAPGVRLARKGVGAIAEALPEENVPEWMKNMATATERERSANANRTVGKELSTVLAKPEAKAGLDEAQRLETEIPGFKPGLARATNDPVLTNTQRKLDSEATGDQLRTSQEAHDSSAKSLRDKFESLAPKTVDNPQDVVHGAEAARVQGEETALNAERGLNGIEQDATNRKLKAAGEALPDAERADSGARLRELHDAAETASDMNTQSLRKKIAEPDTPIQVGEEQTTVNKALDRRAQINQDQRKYASTVGTVEGADKMAALSAERAANDRAIEGINAPGMKEYRDYYRDQHVPDFEEGAGRNVGRYDRFGYDKNKVPDEKVLEQFGGPNNISAAKQFTRIHGENPEAVQLMADHQLGRLKKEAIGPDGTIKEGAVDKFLTKNREMLDALPPQVREAVAAKDPKALYAKLGELEQRQRALADQTVASRLGATPEKTLDGALNDWQVMRDLKRTVAGNPTHEAALTRAVMDRAPDVADAAKFSAWLEGHDRVLRQVLTPAHLNDLKTIARASEIQARVPRPQGSVELPKSLGGEVGEKTGVTIPSAIGSMLSVARGRTSPLTEGPMQGLKLANRLNDRSVNAAWREALSNPDMAKTIGDIVRGKKATPMQMDKMHTYLLASGFTSNVENDQK